MSDALPPSNGNSHVVLETFDAHCGFSTVSSTTTRNRIALIPAYNEARFIGSVILQARNFVDHVIVVDDGSTDATAVTARAAGARVLAMGRNEGKASAITRGIGYIRQLQPTAVVMIDGDGQHDPAEILKVLGPVESGEADIVVGSRFIGIESFIPAWRLIGQHLLTFATNAASGVRSTDSQSGFRAFSPQALPYLDFRANGFSLESEIQFIAAQFGLRLAEVPISVVYAEPPKRNPIPHGLEVLNGVLRLVGQSRPLLFFGLPGLTLFMSGVLVGLHVVNAYHATAHLAIGYALVAVLLCLLGCIGLATGVMLHSVRSLLLDWFRHAHPHNVSLDETRAHVA